MYGLPQAGLLSQQRLVKHRAQHGDQQDKTSPCLYTHTSRPIFFTLVVDDFGVKYCNKQDAQHHFTTLNSLCTLKVDWTGSSYLGIHIAFNDTDHTVTLSLFGYVAKALDVAVLQVSLELLAHLSFIPAQFLVHVNNSCQSHLKSNY